MVQKQFGKVRTVNFELFQSLPNNIAHQKMANCSGGRKKGGKHRGGSTIVGSVIQGFSKIGNFMSDGVKKVTGGKRRKYRKRR